MEIGKPMKLFAQPSPQAVDHCPVNRELIYAGKVTSSDQWWGEASCRWFPVRPLHIGQPVAMFAHPIARLREGTT